VPSEQSHCSFGAHIVVLGSDTDGLNPEFRWAFSKY
jgi:hypothetical protein